MPDLHGFRVTKYNPALRDERGRYRIDEWTAFSDVGTAFDGRTLTREEYDRIEAAYLDAIRLFAECCAADRFQVRGLEDHDEVGQVGEGEIIPLDRAIETARDVLREKYWCKIESDSMRVHLGYDYYMYIEAAQTCPNAIAAIRGSGLFVEEDFPSPYNEEPTEPSG